MGGAITGKIEKVYKLVSFINSTAMIHVSGGEVAFSPDPLVLLSSGLVLRRLTLRGPLRGLARL